MAASLGTSWEELQSKVGFYLGFGRDPDADRWDNEKLAVVEEVIKAGLSAFYFPKPTGNHQKAHEWSFLRPIAEFATVSGTYAYSLPSDFGGFEEMTIDGSTAYCPLRKTGIPEIMRCQASSPSLRSVPTMFAEAPKISSGLLQQTFEAWLHPTPGAVYTMRYRYRVNPKMLDAMRPNPYGGDAHGDTILVSCLAIAERRVNDGAGGQYAEEFNERLAASISRDLDLRADNFGYNGDNSIARSSRKSGRYRSDSVRALYNGQLPEDYVP